MSNLPTGYIYTYIGPTCIQGTGVQGYQFTMQRIDCLPPGSEITQAHSIPYMGGLPVPTGWMVIGVDSTSVAGGNTFTYYRIKKAAGMPSGSTITGCYFPTVSSVPAGWIFSHIGPSCNTAIGTQSYQFTIKRIDSLPPGSQTTLSHSTSYMGGMPIPTGWMITAADSTNIVNGNTFINYTLTKLQGMPSGSTVNGCYFPTVNQMPSGWIFSHIGPTCTSGTGSQGYQFTMKRIDSLAPGNQSSFAHSTSYMGGIPPLAGWMITGIDSSNVVNGNTFYNYTITKLQGMPSGSTVNGCYFPTVNQLPAGWLFLHIGPTCTSGIGTQAYQYTV